MTQPKWAYEDLVEGLTFDLGPKAISAEEIIEFASEFDAQPMHLDEAAGKASLLGGLAASGWHTCAIFMRMLCDAMLSESTSQGTPGIDQVKWKRPVLAGDVLAGKLTVLSRRRSRSKPNLGFVALRANLVNQRKEEVFSLDASVMFLARETA